MNVGRYERENFFATNNDLRAEEKSKQAERKEKEFVKLILSAYKAEPVESFVNVIGKKGIALWRWDLSILLFPQN